MNKALQVLAVLGISIASILFKLVVLTKIWGYVAVPMGAQPMDLIHAWGLTVIAVLATSEWKEVPKRELEENLSLSLKQSTHNFVQSLFAWGFSYWIFG